MHHTGWLKTSEISSLTVLKLRVWNQAMLSLKVLEECLFMPFFLVPVVLGNLCCRHKDASLQSLLLSSYGVLPSSASLLSLFFKFYFTFKLYKIVLVLPNIKMSLPQVYMCSLSWTLLPPPSPDNPSGSSQCTSPKNPVSCIEPGLATHFIHDILYVSMPFSQIFPPFFLFLLLCSLENLY